MCGHSFPFLKLNYIKERGTAPPAKSRKFDRATRDIRDRESSRFQTTTNDGYYVPT
jgi:hypothetical protein